jgi:hypothetical protein
MSNAYNDPVQRLGEKLASSLGIVANPYDAEIDLWVRAAFAVGASVSTSTPLDEARVRVLQNCNITPLI